VKIFNLENALKGKPASKCECVVIATWEEWHEVVEAVAAQSKANPRKKKLKAVSDALADYLAVY
jgi:hypothetical protein